MAPPGPKPKPTALKLAQGNPGKRALNTREPEPEREIPKPPPWLDGDSLRVWNALTPMMLRMGVLTVADAEPVARYCDHIVLWQRARAWIHQHGSTYPIRSKEGRVETGPDGKQHIVFPVTSIAQYPQVAEYRQLSKLMLAFEGEYGLTASSRTRIEVVRIGSVEPQDRARSDFFGAKPRLA